MFQKGFITVLTVLAIFAQVSLQQGTSLDDLINSVFNTKPNVSEENRFQPQPTQTTILNGNNPAPTETLRSCGIDKLCVKRFLCSDSEINTDGTGIIDIRLGSDADTCNYLEICCATPSQTKEPVVNTNTQEDEGCGFRNPNGVGFRIEGGTDEAEFGEFPWMVAILRQESSIGQVLNLYECGGAVIAPNVILTAGHCVQTRKPQELVVRAGEWDTQTKSEILPHQDRYVQEIIVHEKYNKGALFNDVALLILAEPLVWEANVRPICLPESNQPFDYSRCFASGWGKDKFGKEGKYQVILKKIELPLVDHSTCQKNLRTTRLGAFFNLHDSFTCAGGERGMDTCKGDGGSPLVCPIPGTKDRFYQAGIVAWGIGCGEENIPGVYANVQYLRPWINEKLSARGISFQHFSPA